ncbi:MAG: DUF2339 domain-containing protein [bacterium]|nr:DUF2339 domain-containing protein [bacterium]
METVLIEGVLAMMALGFIIGGLLLIATVISLRNRVAKLERLIQQQPGLAMETTQPKPISSIPLSQPPPQAQPQPLPQQPSVPLGSGTTSADRFVRWIREDWLLKLGALLLLVGLSWLASYAFLNNWIGPMGRIALGLVAGTGFIALGWWRIKKFIHQGGIFLVLGSTTVLVTIYAAREVYDFFTPASALAVMFLSTAFVALASVKYNSRSLALSSIILAGIAPVLTNSPTTDNIALFSYLLVVILGAIWIVLLTGRRELTIAALSVVTIYSLPFFFERYRSDSDVLLLFAFAFSALFFLTNLAGIIKSKTGKSHADLVTAAGNGMFLLAWISAAAPPEWKSLIIVAWMVVFVTGAFLISRAARQVAPFYVYASVGIIMLAAATAAELSGPALTVAYTIECGVIVIMTFVLRRDVNLAQRACLLLIVPISRSLPSIEYYSWSDSVFNQHFFVLALLAITIGGLGFFFRYVARTDNKVSAKLTNALFVVASLFAYTLLWLSLRVAMTNSAMAVGTAMLIYTLIGLIVYIRGRATSRRGLVAYGGVMLGFVVLRLLTVDVWKMELTGRIITFLLVGALLMSTAFLIRKKQAVKDETSTK